MLFWHYRQDEFAEAIQADATCPVLSAKIFLFPFGANHFSIRGHPGPHRGAFRDRHGRRAGMRWTRTALLTRVLVCGRQSRVVLTPRRRRQVSQKCLRGDGDKKARSPGRARNKLLKPSRAGMPGDPGATVVTNSCAFYTLRTRLRVQRAPGIPHALCWADRSSTTRALCAAGVLPVVIARESGRSSIPSRQ
jgi:hypothetical protein